MEQRRICRKEVVKGGGRGEGEVVNIPSKVLCADNRGITYKAKKQALAIHVSMCIVCKMSVNSRHDGLSHVVESRD